MFGREYQLQYERLMVGAIMETERRGPASLRRHIANKHFNPDILAWFGVARVDIDVAKRLGINLDWSVERGVQRLEEGWEHLEKDFFKRDMDPYVYRVYGRTGLGMDKIEWSKIMLVKNLIHIEDSNLATVDWARVEAIVPNAKSLTVDLVRDSFDPDVELSLESKGIYQNPEDLKLKLNRFGGH